MADEPSAPVGGGAQPIGESITRGSDPTPAQMAQKGMSINSDNPQTYPSGDMMAGQPQAQFSQQQQQPQQGQNQVLPFPQVPGQPVQGQPQQPIAFQPQQEQQAQQPQAPVQGQQQQQAQPQVPGQPPAQGQQPAGEAPAAPAGYEFTEFNVPESLGADFEKGFAEKSQLHTQLQAKTHQPPEMPDLSKIGNPADPTYSPELVNQKTAQWAMDNANYQSDLNQLRTVENDLNGMQGQYQAAHTKHQVALLQKYAPELTDPINGAQNVRNLTVQAHKAYGVTPERIAGATAMDMIILRDAIAARGQTQTFTESMNQAAGAHTPIAPSAQRAAPAAPGGGLNMGALSGRNLTTRQAADAMAAAGAENVLAGQWIPGTGR